MLSLGIFSAFCTGVSTFAGIISFDNNFDGVKWKTISEIPQDSLNCPTTSHASAVLVNDMTPKGVPVSAQISGRVSQILYLYPLNSKIEVVNKDVSRVQLLGLKKQATTILVICSKTPSNSVLRMIADGKNYEEEIGSISFASEKHSKFQTIAKYLLAPFLIFLLFSVIQIFKVQDNIDMNSADLQ